MTLGELIKQYRDEHSISMDLFAQKTGLSKSYISMLERNKDPRGNEIAPSIETIFKVSKGINMSFDDVFRVLDQNQKVVLNSNYDDNLQHILKDFEAVIDAYNADPVRSLDYLKIHLPLLHSAITSASIKAPPLSDDESELLSMYRGLSEERKKDVRKFTKMFYQER